MSKNNCKFVVTKKDDCCYKTTTETVGGLYGVAVPAFPASSTKDSVHVVRYDDALVTYVYNGTAWVETTNTPITSPVIPGVLVDNGDGTYTWTDTLTTFVIDTTDRVLSTVVYSPATQDFTFTWSNGDTTVVDLTGLLNVYSLLDGNNTVVTGNGISTPWEVNGYGVVDNSDGTFTVTLPDGVTTFLIDTNDVVTSITNTVTGNKIADYTNELGIVTPINETITSIVNNGDGTATFTNESGVATTFPIGAVTVVNNGDGTYTITLADGSTVTISDTSTSTLVDNLDGTYTYTDETGAVTTFNTNDTITTLVDNGDGTLTYTSEDGTVTTFNKGFTSVTNNADGTWTYTYPDLSTTNLDICALLAASSCLPTLTDNGDGTYTFNDGQGNTTTFNGGWTTFANSTNGFTATYPDGSTYVWAETITSLVAATNGWEYTSEDGTTTTVTYLFDNSTPASPNLLVQVNGTTQASIPLNSYDVNITTSGGFTFNPTTDEITITETDGETHVIDLTPLRTTLTSVDGSVEIVPSVNPDGSTNYDLGVKVHTNQVETVPYTGTELPVIAGVTVGDTTDIQFSDGTVVSYTWDGTAWIPDFQQTWAEQRICLNTAAVAFTPADLNNPLVSEVNAWATANLTIQQRENGTKLVYFVPGDGGSCDVPDYEWTLNKGSQLVTLSNKRVFNTKTVYVDASSGSDITGRRGYREFPFKTLDAAIAVTQTGDLLKVFPGTYTQSTPIVTLFHIDCDNGVTWTIATGVRMFTATEFNIPFTVNWSFDKLLRVSTNQNNGLSSSAELNINLTVNTLDLKSHLYLTTYGVVSYYVKNNIDTEIGIANYLRSGPIKHFITMENATSQSQRLIGAETTNNSVSHTYIKNLKSINSIIGYGYTPTLAYNFGSDVGINKQYTTIIDNVTHNDPNIYTTPFGPLTPPSTWKGVDRHWGNLMSLDVRASNCSYNIVLDNIKASGFGANIICAGSPQNTNIYFKMSGVFEKGIPIFLDRMENTTNSVITLDVDLECYNSMGIFFGFFDNHVWNNILASNTIIVTGRIKTRCPGMSCISIGKGSAASNNTNGTILLKDLTLINDGTVSPIMCAVPENVQIQNVTTNSLISDPNIIEVGQSIIRNTNYK